MKRIRGNFPRLCIFPGYNWCGPGCSGPGKPVNAVDAACKEHDICYRNTRDYCRCDDQFVKQLEKLQDPNTEEGRNARLMLQYMRIQRGVNCFFKRP